MDAKSIRPVSGYLTVYVALFVLGRMAVLEGTGLALFWPAAGIAALWMLRGTTARQVAVDASLLLATGVALYLLLGIGPAPALLLSWANLIQGLVVRAFLAYTGGRRLLGPQPTALSTVRDLMYLGAGSVVAALASAPFGAVGAYLNTGVRSRELVLSLLVRNACGTFVVAAAALAVFAVLRTRRVAGRERYSVLTGEPRPHALLELAIVALLSTPATLLVFTPREQFPLTFLLIAFSAWIGFRFTPVVGAVHALTLGVVAVLLTLSGTGPFSSVGGPSTHAIMTQIFVTITAVIVLMLSVGVAERQALQARALGSEARATARAEMLDAVTAAMVDGLVVVGASDNVVLQNPAAEAMTGETDGEDDDDESSPVTGPPDFRALNGSPLRPAERPHVRALRGEVVPPTDLMYVDPETGQESIVSVSAVPLHGDDGPTGRLAVLVIHDVTKERTRTRELQSFAGVVAHDLKSPLSAVSSWTEILYDQLDASPVDASAARTSLLRIYTSANRMNQLISDLLEYSQAQNADLDPRQLSLDSLVDDVTQQLVESSPDASARIEHAPLGSVLADPVLVRQLMTNVLGNAVKYVAPGTSPHVQITSRETGGMLEVRVSDNGIGIPADARGRVFDSFFRAAGEGYAGTGLGLAICARAVERHGGRISVRPGPHGVGTTLIFTLPAGLPARVSAKV